MWKRSGTVLFAAIIAATLGLSISASATTATTWTFKPGGKITGTSGTVTLTDTTTHSVLSCASSTTAATAKSGSGLAGAGIANITANVFKTCTGGGFAI